MIKRFCQIFSALTLTVTPLAQARFLECTLDPSSIKYEQTTNLAPQFKMLLVLISQDKVDILEQTYSSNYRKIETDATVQEGGLLLKQPAPDYEKDYLNVDFDDEGRGVDMGCTTNRFRSSFFVTLDSSEPTILATDRQFIFHDRHRLSCQSHSDAEFDVTTYRLKCKSF